MTTYSLNSTGYRADNYISTIKQLDVPDTNLSGNGSGTAGGAALTMQTGDLVLCKGPDGGQHWYKIDAERSTPTVPVLLFVGP